MSGRLRELADAEQVLIQNVSIEPDGVTVSYTALPTDVRVDGYVHEGRSLSISRERYGDEIDAVQQVLRRFLLDVIEDFDESPPYSMEDEDDDDERGMGE